MSRVLLIEDQPSDVVSCVDALGHIFQMHHANTMSRARAVLLSPGLDAVVLDLGLPELSGASGLTALLETPGCPPVVVLTEDLDPSDAEALIHAGAEDCVQKSRIDSDLERAVRFAVARHWAHKADQSAGARLEIVREGELVWVAPFVRGVVRLGRSGANEVLFVEGCVSRHHALFRLLGDKLWLEELGSANGTLVNDELVTRRVAVAAGADICFGGKGGPMLRIIEVDPETNRVVAELREGVVPWGRLDAPTTQTFASPEPAEEALSQTDDSDVFPYEVVVAVDGSAGTTCTVTSVGAKRAVLTAGTRVALLQALAERHAGDVAQGVPVDQAGWMVDHDVAARVWNGGSHGGEANRLSVLIHRVRREIDDAGLEGACLEKRRGAVRLAVRSARVV